MASSPQAVGWARLARVNPILWAGRSSWHALWQLRAREVTWSTSRTTKFPRKGKTGVGPHRVLGKAATLTSGGDCPVPSKRGKEHLQCDGSVRILTLLTSRLRIMTWRSFLAMRWPMRSPRRQREAAVRGAAAEQIAWVDAMAWQVQRRIIEANMQASKANPTVLTLREKGLRRVQYKTVLQALFEQTTHQLAFPRSRQRWECQTCKQSMGETSLVRWLRAGPCSCEIQTMQSIGNSLGMDVQQVRAGAYIPIGWKIVHPSHSVAQYRGVTWCWNCAAMR